LPDLHWQVTQPYGLQTENTEAKQKEEKENYFKWFHSFIRISFVLERNVGSSLCRRVFGVPGKFVCSF
jgi:hypothetical protein